MFLWHNWDVKTRKIVISVLLVGVAFVVGLFVYSLLSEDDWEKQKISSGELNANYPLSYSVSTDELDYSEKFTAAYELIKDLDVGDYLVVVDISEQREYVYKIEGDIKKASAIDLERVYRISTGADQVKQECTEEDEEEECEDGYKYVDRGMSQSVWQIRSKMEGPFGALYGPRVMMLNKKVSGGWTATNVALHGTDRPDLLGTPWSLGCVYHNNDDILELFEWLEIGDLVVAID